MLSPGLTGQPTKDVQGGHPHAQGDLRARLRQALGDGPAKALQPGASQQRDEQPPGTG